MSEISWQLLRLQEMNAPQLLAVLKARQAVFIIEQNCIYPDIDDYDAQSWHLLGSRGDELLAYLRLIPPGLRYQEASFGRVLTTAAARGEGLGHALMRETIPAAARLFPDSGLRISAQQHLKNYYGRYGFKTVSAPYDEDGIPHIEMLLETLSPEKQ